MLPAKPQWKTKEKRTKALTLTIFFTTFAMVWQLLIVYFTVWQCGPPVCAFLHPPIFRSWPTRVKDFKHSVQLQSDVPVGMTSPLQKLKEALGKGDRHGFKRILRVIYEDNRHCGLRKSEKDELRLIYLTGKTSIQVLPKSLRY
jgi:hypothetical protein